MKMDTFRVAMHPHGLLCSGIEAYSLQEAFASVPGPPGPQKRAKNDKNMTNLNFAVFSAVFFSLKGLFGVTAVVIDQFSDALEAACAHAEYPKASSTPTMNIL